MTERASGQDTRGRDTSTEIEGRSRPASASSDRRGARGLTGALLALLTACASPTTTDPTGDDDPLPDGPGPVEPFVEYPSPDWRVATPASVDLDEAKLNEASVAASGNASYCLLVIRHGVLVAEHYYGGATAATTPKSWSVAKSYTAVTTGIAIANGDLPPLDTPLTMLLPELAASTATVRDLLAMTTGLDWSIYKDYLSMATFSSDHTAHALDRSFAHAPGTDWTYNNAAVQLAEPIFRAATPGTIEDYARAELWSKIGMAPTTTWAHDDAGHPTAYANVLATCRDHARLGYLMLHGGRWKAEQVIPAAFVADALTPSQTLNRGYGFLWWVNGQSPTKSAMNKAKAEMIFPYAPADLVTAKGFGSQFIDVIPSLDMVVVRFGKDPMADMTIANAQEMLISDDNSDTHRDILIPILEAVLR